MIILRQREIRDIVDVEVTAEGLVDLNPVTTERADLRQLISNVAVDPEDRHGLDRYDFMTVERRRDLIGEEIGAATLGGDAEAEARDALVDGRRLGIELALRANVRLLHDDDGIGHGEDEAADVQSLARVRALIFGLHVRTREGAGAVGGGHCALGGDVAPI